MYSSVEESVCSCDLVNNWSVVLFLRYLQLVRGLFSDHSWSGSGDFPEFSSPCMEDRGPAEPALGGLWQRLELWVCCATRRPGAPPWLCTIKMTEMPSYIFYYQGHIWTIAVIYVAVYMLSASKSADFSTLWMLKEYELYFIHLDWGMVDVFIRCSGNIAEIVVTCRMVVECTS